MNWETTAPAEIKPKQGLLEFRVKNGLFSSWILVQVKIEGRWLALYKKENSIVRIGAIELGQGVQIKSMEDLDNFPRRFDITCTGGALQAIEWNFRLNSRKDRDSWVRAILSNLKIFRAHDIEAFPKYREFEQITQEMMQGIPTAVRLVPKSSSASRKNNSNASKEPLNVKSFSGYDAVSFLISHNYATSQEAGERICQILLSMNLIHHLVWAQDFSTYELFCFTQDQVAATNVQIFENMIEVGKFWIYVPIPIAVAVAYAETSSVLSSPRKELAPSSASISSLNTRNASNLSNRQLSLNSRTPSSHSSSDMSKDTVNSMVDILDESKWANPDMAKQCHCCEKNFNPLRRKHHCRLCGFVVCATCGVNTTVGHVNRAINVRVCIKCRLRMKQHVEASRHNGSEQSSSHRLSASSHATNWTSMSDPVVPTQQCNICYDCDNKCHPQATASPDFPLDFDWGNRWPKPPRRLNEDLCIKTLNSIRVCEQPDPWFDQLCDVLVSNTSCEKAVVGFLTETEFVLMGTSGSGHHEKSIPFDVAFAPHAVMSAEPLVCCDVGEDIRFQQNRPMRQQWQVGFYASFPLVASCGLVLGAVEVYDEHPRPQCHNVHTHLEAVAELAVQYIDELIDHNKKAEEAKNATPAAPTSTMEGTLMQLLEKTTGTQTQLQQQQAQMVHAVGNHSEQINMLAEKLQRIEAAIDKKNASKAA